MGRLVFDKALGEWLRKWDGIYIRVRPSQRVLLQPACRSIRLFILGENSFMSWAKILDCGDAPLTFLDNTVALKQLEKAHKVCYTEFGC